MSWSALRAHAANFIEEPSRGARRRTPTLPVIVGGRDRGNVYLVEDVVEWLKAMRVATVSQPRPSPRRSVSNDTAKAKIGARTDANVDELLR
jgi:hypothetical protein